MVPRLVHVAPGLGHTPSTPSRLSASGSAAREMVIQYCCLYPLASWLLKSVRAAVIKIFSPIYFGHSPVPASQSLTEGGYVSILQLGNWGTERLWLAQSCTGSLWRSKQGVEPGSLESQTNVLAIALWVSSFPPIGEQHFQASIPQ